VTGEFDGGVARPPEDLAYARPDGLADPFEPREPAAAYQPPPPTVSPQDQAQFGRPAGAGEYAPPPGDRLGPRATVAPPVPPQLTAQFGPSRGAVDGFDPAPGTRIAPGPGPAESPWWKPGAARDPWRDPSSPFWLGRAAVFSAGRLEQLDPDHDTEASDEDVASAAEDEGPAAPASARRLRFGLSTLAICIVIALVAGALGGGAGYWLANRANHLLHRSVSLSKVGQPANRPPGSVADIAKRVGPAVVSIQVTTSSEYAVGSGVVIDGNGYVLTNNHVVAAAASGAGTIVVTFSDEASAKAQIVGRDPQSDLAVLKVPATKLTVAALGDSDQLAVGDPVIAIGSPLGLQGTVTAGIVSALNRPVAVAAPDGNSTAYYNAVQTDAPINPGNSGGALVDAAGAVVGINSAGVPSTQDNGQQVSVSGIGYAIPINYARTIAEELIKSGKAVHGSLGAQGVSATTVDFKQQGAYLEQVVPKGPAANAGLKNGDVIVAADGSVVSSYEQLVVIVQAHKPGDKIDVTYVDGAAKKTTTVTLGTS
jgi:S1-C subfamily serine protease